MTEQSKCPECGATMPPDGQDKALCPKCLLQAGFASDVSALEQQTVPPRQNQPFGGSVLPSVEELNHLFTQLEFVELIGQGGMGAVYKARQPSLDRLVAVKILLPEIGRDPTFADRFTREARALAKLNHAGIVTVHDVGEVGGLFYLVMEHIEGVNLREALQAERVDSSKALAIVQRICEALQFAHDHGVVHRDIKPENILLTADGAVKIADFGLAKLVGHGNQAHTLTAPEQVMGTPRYMAPEQLEQGAHDVDHRADIYSLGVVFYELLTGALPLGRFEPPSQKVQIDVRLDDVVLRALENRPEHRYQRAADVATDVNTITTGIPGKQIPAPEVDSAPRKTPASRWPSKRFAYEVLGLYSFGWVVTAALWNLGWAGLLGGGLVLVLLSFVVTQRARHFLPHLQQFRGGATPSLWRKVNSAFGFLFGFALAAFIAVNSWSTIDFTPFGEAARADFVRRFEGREHRLLRSLPEFKEEIPDAELVMGGYSGGTLGSLPSSLPWGIGWLMLLALMAASVNSLAVAFRRLLEPGKLPGQFGAYWREMLSLGSLGWAALILAHLLPIMLFPFGTYGSSSRNVKTASGLDEVKEAIREWCVEENYQIASQNNWSVTTVPIGKRIANVDNVQMHQKGVFNEWHMSWRGPSMRSPRLMITCISSNQEPATVVRIGSGLCRKGTEQDAAWNAVIDRLKATLEAL